MYTKMIKMKIPKINFFQRFKRTSVIVQGLAGLERTDGVD